MPTAWSCVGVTASLPVKACCRHFHLNKQAHKFVMTSLLDGGKVQDETMGPVKVSLLD